MPKKLLSILLSCTVFLYGVVGCSRYDEKVGLNVNLEPPVPIVDDVTGNQNSNTDSDLPKPAVDDVSDQSSDTKPEPSKAVVENKEEVKEDKDKEVAEESKPKDDDADNKPDEKKDPEPPANPPNNNIIQQHQGLFIGAAAALGLGLIVGLVARLFGGPPPDPDPQPAEGDDDHPGDDNPGDDNPGDGDPPGDDDHPGDGDPPAANGGANQPPGNQTEGNPEEDQTEEDEPQLRPFIPRVPRPTRLHFELEGILTPLEEAENELFELYNYGDLVYFARGTRREVLEGEMREIIDNIRRLEDRILELQEQQPANQVQLIAQARAQRAAPEDDPDYRRWYDAMVRTMGREEAERVIEGQRQFEAREEARQAEAARRAAQNPPPAPTPEEIRRAEMEQRNREYAAQRRRERRLAEERAAAREEEIAAARARLMDQRDAELAIIRDVDIGTIRRERLQREREARLRNRGRPQQREVIDVTKGPPMDGIDPCTKGNGG